MWATTQFQVVCIRASKIHVAYKLLTKPLTSFQLTLISKKKMISGKLFSGDISTERSLPMDEGLFLGDQKCYKGILVVKAEFFWGYDQWVTRFDFDYVS